MKPMWKMISLMALAPGLLAGCDRANPGGSDTTFKSSGSSEAIVDSQGSPGHHNDAMVLTGPDALSDGVTATIEVRLAGDLFQNGTTQVHLASSDLSRVTITPSDLTFTDENWDEAQTVTISGVVALGQSDGSVVISAKARGITMAHSVAFHHVPVFQTVDRDPSRWNSSGKSITIDPNGNIYVVGNDYNDQGIIKKSTDGGDTWSADRLPHHVNTIAVDSASGDLYIGGLTCTDIAHDGGCNHLAGITRKSADHGQSWNVVDTFSSHPLMSGETFGVNGIVVDGQGNVYAAGNANGAWVVRVSRDHGISWRSVDVYQATASHQSTATAIAIDPTGRVFVAGYGTDSANRWRWIVRRSSDSGASWSSVDEYVLDGNSFAIPKAIATDSAGNVYVAGFEAAFRPGVFYPPSNGIVRKGADDGITWTTVDTSTTRRNAAVVAAITTDAAGRVYAAGFDGTHWTTKVSVDGGSSWSLLDAFGGGWGAQGIAVNSSGFIYVTGESPNWVTRRLWP
jgi:hypothetical protein